MKISLNQQIFLGAIVGAGLGFVLRQIPAADPLFSNVIYVAELVAAVFVNLLKMIIIPLVFSSIVVGIVNLKAHQQMRKVWVVTLTYFMISSTCASVLGLLVMNVFKPGVGLSTALFSVQMAEFKAAQMSVGEFIKSFLGNVFLNPIAAMAKGEVLAVVVFAMFLGAALLALRERGRHTTDIINELFEILMVMVGWIMRLAPVGILALLVKLVATQDVGLLKMLGQFVLVILGATLFHGLVILPAALTIVGKYSPIKFFGGFKEALLTALTTSSSNATLPISIKCARENLGVRKEIAGFVFPLGATINMDGTALYEASAALLVANLSGVELNLAQQIIVLLTSVLASMGAPGIPSAGMVTMVMVLQSVGLPVEAIAILLPMDRILDTFRTMVNVEGDAVGALIVQRLVPSMDQPRVS